MNETIYRQAAIDTLADMHCKSDEDGYVWIIRSDAWARIDALPSAQPEDYTEMKQEFLRMESYIDVLLECSDVQKETLIGFISRLAEFMPWTERD